MNHLTNRYVQIGNICVQWSAIEYHVAIAIWNLAGVVDQEIGKVLTASLDLKGRVTMAFKLAHIVTAPVPFKIALKPHSKARSCIIAAIKPCMAFTLKSTSPARLASKCIAGLVDAIKESKPTWN